MTTAEILAKVASGELSANDAQSLLAASQQQPLTYKVSQKGCLSVYGFGKWPVSLYLNQWERLDADVENRRQFIEAHRHELKEKE